MVQGLAVTPSTSIHQHQDKLLHHTSTTFNNSTFSNNESKSSSFDTLTTMMTTQTPPSTSSPVATHLPINPTHGGMEKTGAASLVLALLVSTCVSAMLATLLCCHVAACRVCRPQRRHVQESIGHVQERTLGHVQESRLLGQVELEERMVSQAAARAVDIIYREAISCRSREDQVLYPSSMTVGMKVSYIPSY